MNLNQAIEAVREERKALIEHEDIVATKQIVIGSTPEYWALERARELYRQASEGVAALETMLRELTIAEYEATGNKKPAKGVGIRVKPKAVYKKDGALKQWVRQNIPLILVPDYKKLDKAILDMDDLTDVPAEIVEVVTATIAREL